MTQTRTPYPETSLSGKVTPGDAAIVTSALLADNEELKVVEATVVLSDGQPAPSGLDLIVASLDGAGNGTNQATVLSGDGSNQLVNQSGSPLASYTNSTGGQQMAAVFVDNGNFGGGTGSDQDVQAAARGGIA